MDRRGFLGAGLGASVLGAVAARRAAGGALPEQPAMREAGAPFSNYGRPSPSEQDIVRWIVANPGAPGNGVSWCPLHELEGIVTPNGLHFERHHNGVPRIAPEDHRLLVHGLVERPLVFRIADLLRYPLRSRLCFLECGGNSNAGWHRRPVQAPAGYVHGLVSCSEWTGVPLATVLAETGVRSGASWLVAEGADAFAMNVSIPLAEARRDALLALYQNGERLRPENGYPLRLLLPGREGVLNVKWLRRLQLSDRPIMARNETSRYTELLPSGKARQFTGVMEVKSLLLSPSAGMSLPGPGLYQLSGLAWSGRGRILRVEVSADGGRQWREATLEGPSLPCCFTRFRHPWRWSGGPAVLQSRALDESGAWQPDRAALIAERGRHGYFHYHAIVSWQVEEDGTVRSVYGDAGGSGGAAPADIGEDWF